MIRALLLKASDNRWLREHGVRAPFVRRAVSRFMPGETFDDMLGAAQQLQTQRIDSVFTRLGENVTDLGEAHAVASHYLEGVTRIRALKLDCEPSIKLTQLGLDIDRGQAIEHARAIAARAHDTGSYLWIDMEQSPYVDVTLDIAAALRKDFPRVGVCLQAYLRRTPKDLERMHQVGAGVRLVKGAYREPATVAFPEKRAVDEAYFALASTMIDRAATSRAVFGTHDVKLIGAICDHARGKGVAPGSYEFHMLFGIQRGEQARLAATSEQVRVLIAYGTYWFPWYMRRLAERPANVWFVAKSVFAR